jgi:hypothetical protein
MSKVSRQSGYDIILFWRYDFNDLIIGIKMIDISSEGSPGNKFLKLFFCHGTVSTCNPYHKYTVTWFVNFNIQHKSRQAVVRPPSEYLLLSN